MMLTKGQTMFKAEGAGMRDGVWVEWHRNAETKENTFWEGGKLVHRADGSYSRGLIHWVGFKGSKAVVHTNAGHEGIPEGGETTLVVFPDGSVHFIPPYSEGGYIGMAMPSLAFP